MYIVTQDGRKLKVIDQNKENSGPFCQTVGLYDENTVLKPIWIVTGEKRNVSNDELEFKAEKVYEHKPSKEELLWFMSANGLKRYDIVYVTQGFTLDIE